MPHEEIAVSPPRAWVEINLLNLLKNLEFAKKVSGCGIMAVVKAGAYGHGLEEISKVLESGGVEFFGVANIGEARRLREAGVAAPIYLLGASWDAEREEIVARNVTPCISSVEEARDFHRIAMQRGVCLAVHLAVDTGMGRGGFLPDDLVAVAAQLQEFGGLKVEGIASHLSSSDEDVEFTNYQIGMFEAAVKRLGGAECFLWRHLSNSGGILGFPGGVCNLARPGLLLYGVSPIPEYQEKLCCVMQLKSRVTLVRVLPKGASVSYGRSFITVKPTRVATVGIGYGDGYPRHVSGKGAEVFVRGMRCPVIGRVTMDQLMIQLPDESDVATGDEVELFGEHIPVSEVAQYADTISWEVFTGITPRVQRVYLRP